MPKNIIFDMKYLKLYERKDLSEIEPGDIIRTKLSQIEKAFQRDRFELGVLVEMVDSVSSKGDVCMLLRYKPDDDHYDLLYKHKQTVKNQKSIILSVNELPDNKIRYFVKTMLGTEWIDELSKQFNDILEKWKKFPRIYKIIEEEKVNTYTKKYNL